MHDFVDNHIPTPDVSQQMYGGGIVGDLANNASPNYARLRRPFFNDRDIPCVVVNRGRYTVERGERRGILEEIPIRWLQDRGWQLPPVTNATTLRKEEWIELDRQVLAAQRQRLRAWADLAAANTFGGFNGMGKMVLEHETMSDPGEAMVDMDGITEARTDNPKFQLEGLPLPITHSDYWMSSRRLAVSRNSGTPLDSSMGEAAARRVAEMVEKTTIGVETGITYGGVGTPSYGRASRVFGYTNFTDRNTRTITAPTAGGWSAATTVSDVLAMRQDLFGDNFFGPYILYHSTGWDKYMDNDYSTSGGNNPNQTLRQRLRTIEGISDIRRLDFLTTDYTLVLVEMNANVARAVNGMDMTTVQWEAKGGMQLMFKVMCIYVPQLRADFSGKCGICHGSS